MRMHLVGENQYGRLVYPSVRKYTTDAKLRKMKRANREFVHRTKNGIYDPITYYHLVDALAMFEPNEMFRVAEILRLLQIEKPQLVWDSTTVGRCLADIAESLELAYGFKVIRQTKRWNGMNYIIEDHERDRIALHRLLEDLYVLSQDIINREIAGEVIKRTASPLGSCPSLDVSVPGEMGNHLA